MDRGAMQTFKAKLVTETPAVDREKPLAFHFSWVRGGGRDGWWRMMEDEDEWMLVNGMAQEEVFFCPQTACLLRIYIEWAFMS